ISIHWFEPLAETETEEHKSNAPVTRLFRPKPVDDEPNMLARTALERCSCAVTTKGNLVKVSACSSHIDCHSYKETSGLYIDINPCRNMLNGVTLCGR